MGDSDTDPNIWAAKLDQASVQIWRESLAHLRHLSDEVWKCAKFFMAINGFALAAMLAIAAANLDSNWGMIFEAILAALGLGCTVIGRYILRRNRIYYLEMLLKKTLLEDEFGFYEAKFSGTNIDAAFPWRLKPEVISELKQKPEDWVSRQIRGPGTIARWLFVMLEATIVIYSLALVGLTSAWLR